MKIWAGLLIIVLAVSLLAAQCGSSAAPQVSTPKITIANPYARPASAGGNGVVYLTLTNESSSLDTLLSVTSLAAAAAELHETIIDAHDIAKMSPLSQVNLPAGEPVSLEPGGKHIMLVNLKRDLKIGDKIEIILTFEKSGSLTVEAEIQEGGQSAEHAPVHSEQEH